MKLFLASLGVGILIPASLVALILTVKILRPGTTLNIVLLWFFVWPTPFLLSLFPGVATETVLLIAFVVGTVVDIAFLSFLSYRVLRAIQRSKAPTH